MGGWGGEGQWGRGRGSRRRTVLSSFSESGNRWLYRSSLSVFSGDSAQGIVGGSGTGGGRSAQLIVLAGGRVGVVRQPDRRESPSPSPSEADRTTPQTNQDRTAELDRRMLSYTDPDDSRRNQQTSLGRPSPDGTPLEISGKQNPFVPVRPGRQIHPALAVRSILTLGSGAISQTTDIRKSRRHGRKRSSSFLSPRPLPHRATDRKWAL